MSRVTISDLLREARSRLDRLEPAKALEAQRAGALLIDTRSRDERSATGIIPGSIHIPRSVLEWRLDPDADPAYRNPHIEGLDQWLVLVCAHGYSTSLAAATLCDLGFTRATDIGRRLHPLDGARAAGAGAGYRRRPRPGWAARTLGSKMVDAMRSPSPGRELAARGRDGRVDARLDALGPLSCREAHARAAPGRKRPRRARSRIRTREIVASTI